jgi:hypothetical protein
LRRSADLDAIAIRGAGQLSYYLEVPLDINGQSVLAAVTSQIDGELGEIPAGQHRAGPAGSADAPVGRDGA